MAMRLLGKTIYMSMASLGKDCVKNWWHFPGVLLELLQPPVGVPVPMQNGMGKQQQKLADAWPE